MTTISVAADVVDLRKDVPRADDKFFVDTNVWYWVGYTNASHNAKNYQVTAYPQYLDRALLVSSQLYVCTLSFAELAHIIERVEREIYNKLNGTDLGPKQFRHEYAAERANIVTEIENAWNLADAIAGGNLLDVSLSRAEVDAAITRLQGSVIDGYDVFMIEALLSQDINQVITDDMDFGTVPDITVFSANNTLINAARDQGKLKRR